MKADPFDLGIWDGISVANYSDLSTWPVVPEADLQPYIDDALNEIEFIVGDAKTTQWGKVRASLGRTEPYALKFIEMCVRPTSMSVSHPHYVIQRKRGSSRSICHSFSSFINNAKLLGTA